MSIIKNEDYRDEGRKLFARANRWKYTDRCFSLTTLIEGKARSRNCFSHPRMFDHAEYYVKDRRAVAIVGHNYVGDQRDLREWIASRTDLVLHVPEAGCAASWYYPGFALPMCVTRPGFTVVWPSPEQMARTASAYAIFWDADRKKSEAWNARCAQKAAWEKARSQVLAVYHRFGTATTLALLEPYGARKITDLTPEQHPLLTAAAEALLRQTLPEPCN